MKKKNIDPKCKYCGKQSNSIYQIIGELGLWTIGSPPKKLNTVFCCGECYDSIWKVIRLTLNAFKAISKYKVRKIK